MSKWQGHNNSGKSITPAVVSQVRNLANHNTPTRVIAGLTGRTESSVPHLSANNRRTVEPTHQTANLWVTRKVVSPLRVLPKSRTSDGSKAQPQHRAGR